MKRTAVLSIWVLSLMMSCALVSEEKVSQDSHVSVQEEMTSRRTGISLPNGDILHEVADKNVSSTNGVMSIDVDTLETPVEIGSGMYLRNNSANNILEISYDGIKWEEIGASSSGSGSVVELRYEWQVDGSVVAGTTVDLSRRIMADGDITSIEAFLGNTGSGGDDFIADVLNDGISIYTSGGTPPTITANSGNNQVDISTDFVDYEVADDDIISLDLITVPDDAEDLHVVLTQQIDALAERTHLYQWVVAGTVVSGVLDIPRYISQTGQWSESSCVLGNTGTGGADFVADFLINGTSIYALGGTQPTISANSGNNQIDIETTFGATLGQVGDIIEFDADSVPDGAEDVVCSIIQTIPETHYIMYTWTISGSIITGTSFDVPRMVLNDGLIVVVSAILENTGNGGDALTVDVNVNGVSLYSGGGTPPSIAANSGIRQVSVSSDMATTIVSQGDVITIDIDTAPTSANGLTIQLIQQILQ